MRVDCGVVHEKGGVVRRPFSKLQAWLIAVSPRRESLSLSARRSGALSAERGNGGGAAKHPRSAPDRPLRWRNRSSPLSDTHLGDRRIVARCE
jgi:hypothetical protein